MPLVDKEAPLDVGGQWRVQWGPGTGSRIKYTVHRAKIHVNRCRNDPAPTITDEINNSASLQSPTNSHDSPYLRNCQQPKRVVFP